MVSASDLGLERRELQNLLNERDICCVSNQKNKYNLTCDLALLLSFVESRRGEKEKKRLIHLFRERHKEIIRSEHDLRLSKILL